MELNELIKYNSRINMHCYINVSIIRNHKKPQKSQHKSQRLFNHWSVNPSVPAAERRASERWRRRCVSSEVSSCWCRCLWLKLTHKHLHVPCGCNALWSIQARSVEWQFYRRTHSLWGSDLIHPDLRESTRALIYPVGKTHLSCLELQLLVE